MRPDEPRDTLDEHATRAVDDAVRRHFATQRLDDDAVARILERASPRSAPAAPPSERRPWTTRLAALAALVALALGAVVLLRPTADDAAGELELAEQVVAEVAKNHRKAYEVDVATSRYEELQAALDRLDVSILPTRPSLLRDHELLGGRYCSVQSQLAAQLSLRDRATGEARTLYVAPLRGRLVDLEPRVGRDEAAGKPPVRVEIWRDDGRLFALAGDADG